MFSLGKEKVSHFSCFYPLVPQLVKLMGRSKPSSIYLASAKSLAVIRELVKLDYKYLKINHLRDFNIF